MKKFFREIIFGVSALAMCLTLAPMNVSAATTYYRGDVTGDGTVDVRDTTALTRYLNGRAGAGPKTADRLDVNRDYIIDKNDLQHLNRILIKTETSDNISYNNTTMTTCQDNDLNSEGNAYLNRKEYFIYNAQTGNYVENYTLERVSDIIPSSASTYANGIIGIDNRDVDYSNNGIVKLSTGGTGIVVGNHTILTAAHCLGAQTTNCVPNITCTIYQPNNNGQEIIIGTYTAVSYHVPRSYVDKPNLGGQYDYAIIVVSENLNNYIGFDLGICRDGLTALNPTIYITGYSGDDPPDANHNLKGKIVTGSGNFRPISPTYKYQPAIISKVLHYNIDMVGGESGAPIYYINSTTGTKTVIGLNTNTGADTSYNFGKRIDTDVLHFVYNNPKL